jgi:hypothetical protein
MIKFEIVHIQILFKFENWLDSKIVHIWYLFKIQFLKINVFRFEICSYLKFVQICLDLKSFKY